MFNHRPLKKPKFNWYGLAVVFLVIFLILFWVVALPLIIYGPILAQQISALEKNVSQAKDFLVDNNWDKLNESLIKIDNDIKNIRADLKKLGLILYWPSIGRTADSADKLLSATSDLLSGYGKIFGLLGGIAQNFKGKNSGLGFSEPEQKKELLKSISENRQIFFAVENSVEAAKQRLRETNTNNLWRPLKEKILSFDQLLRQAVDNTETVLPIASNLPELLGYEREKTYLFIFQNNMEIRPTGGFIGSYGLITAKDGEIKNIFTDDIYNLDKFSEGKLEAPAPLPMLIYNKQKNWFMRDANWSPDWPTAAKNILWFFNEERKNARLAEAPAKRAGLPPQRVDGVIAITPDFIANLLAVMGPVMADGVNFAHQDFANVLENFVEQDYKKRGISETSRKAIIGSLTKILIDNIHNLPLEDLAKLWLAFKKNIDQKNILVYLTNPDLQKYFTEKNWSGEVKSTKGDYLMVVDSNFAALKTDSVMEKLIAYEVNENNNGDLIGRVIINYNHQGKHTPGLITNYRTYVRVYAPAGTWFLRGYIQDKDQITNLDLAKNLEARAELGKKYFATFLTVDPGDNKTLVLEYRLPDNIKKEYQRGLYTFIVQKQPGTIGHNLKINLNFNKYISAYNTENSPTKFAGKSVEWDTDLSVDRGIVLKF
ncbi:MAG: DUF4012 domain-containing protein [Patescibacteria group bacterium]